MKTVFVLALLVAAAEGFGGVKNVLDGTCVGAGPQSPRDVSAGSMGSMSGPAPLDSLDGLIQVNTHFHLGAEHKSDGEYDQDMELFGFACKTDGLAAAHLQDYDFKYCKDVEVGQTYEFHWVHSSGGDPDPELSMGPGLGGAFATTDSPTVVVQGQVFVVVNDDVDYNLDLMDGSTFKGLGSDIVMYKGSTTGPSYNNVDKCSPYDINWHVDRKCQIVSAKALDDVCRRKKEMGMADDTHPHGSREVISKMLSVDTLY